MAAPKRNLNRQLTVWWHANSLSCRIKSTHAADIKQTISAGRVFFLGWYSVYSGYFIHTMAYRKQGKRQRQRLSSHSLRNKRAISFHGRQTSSARLAFLIRADHEPLDPEQNWTIKIDSVIMSFLNVYMVFFPSISSPESMRDLHSRSK